MGEENEDLSMFASFLPTLEEFARENGMVLSFNTYQGDSYCQLGWVNSQGCTCFIYLHPWGREEFILHVRCFKSHPLGRGQQMGKFCPRYDPALFHEALEKAREWAEGCHNA